MEELNDDLRRARQQPLLVFNDSKEPYKSEGACGNATATKC